MYDTALQLPTRSAKPRSRGVTMVMDSGLPTRQFCDVLTSFAGLIDVVKLGWGTCLVTDDLSYKLDALYDHGVDFYFGGTLFEKFLSQNRFSDWVAFCEHHRCRYVEVSNGTIGLSNEHKARYVRSLAGQFHVFSEVGLKDPTRSEQMSARHWIDYIAEDLAAGAHMVITESRESGKSGICDPSGSLKTGLIDEIADSGLDLDRVLFEAPTKELQVQLIRRLGSQVNLGNINPNDIVSLETLRLGLRSDTLLDFPAGSTGDPRPGGRSLSPRLVRHA